VRFLHINTKDIVGGAARATYRLHHALLNAGHDSHILCAVKQLPGNESSSLFPGRYGWFWNCLVGKLSMDTGLGWRGYPSRAWLRKSQRIFEWADAIVLGNLHGWFFPLDLLPLIANHVPLIWRLHDMWAATSCCTYAYDCERWKTGCGHCPRLREYPSMTFDLTRKMWKQKRTIYTSLSASDMCFSTPSRWLRDAVRASPLTGHLDCHAYPNGVSLDVFQPRDRTSARAAYGLRENDKAIMFSYASKADAWRKGDDMLVPVLEALPPQLTEMAVLFVVGEQPKRSSPLPVRTISTGYLGDESQVADCYSAADIFLNLSRADNLPNCLVEAAACGLPAVTLDSGGCAETVVHGKTGFAVKTTMEVSEAVSQLLSSLAMRRAFSSATREFACDHFSDNAYAQHIVELATALEQDRPTE